MALHSTGQISLSQVRSEYRTGFGTTGPLSPSNYTGDLRTFYTENYWNKPTPSATDNKISDFYGSTGQSGYFSVARRGNSSNYMYGWKEYGGGGFIDPEAGDSISAMGSATYSTQSRFFSNFYVTGVLIGDYDSYGYKLAVWGIDLSGYSSTRSPRNMEFRSGSNTVTLNSADRYNSSATTQQQTLADYSYVPTNRVTWIWSNQSSSASNNTNIDTLYSYFTDAYTNGTNIYWRTT